MYRDNLQYGVNGLLPSIGLQLKTGKNYNANDLFYQYTTPEFQKTGYCKHCGIPFIRVSLRDKKVEFCSKSCALKYCKRKIKEANLRLACAKIDKKDFTHFFKKYQNFAYKKIYEYDSEFREDLIDFWNENAIWLFYKLKAKECIPAIMKYIDSSIYHHLLELRRSKKEVFYDECSIRTQNYILGEINERY